jgi:hypothetical protein
MAAVTSNSTHKHYHFDCVHSSRSMCIDPFHVGKAGSVVRSPRRSSRDTTFAELFFGEFEDGKEIWDIPFHVMAGG